MAEVSNNIVRRAGDTWPSKSIIKVNGVAMDITGWRIEVRYIDGKGKTRTIDCVHADEKAGKILIYPHARAENDVIGQYREAAVHVPAIPDSVLQVKYIPEDEDGSVEVNKQVDVKGVTTYKAVTGENTVTAKCSITVEDTPTDHSAEVNENGAFTFTTITAKELVLMDKPFIVTVTNVIAAVEADAAAGIEQKDAETHKIKNTYGDVRTHRRDYPVLEPSEYVSMEMVNTLKPDGKSYYEESDKTQVWDEDEKNSEYPFYLVRLREFNGYVEEHTHNSGKIQLLQRMG